jgi:hypothetical protein
MSYPRKSTFTLGQLLSILEANNEFANLEDAQKIALINHESAKIASYRNQLAKEDYWFSSDDSASVFSNVTEIDTYDFLRKAVLVVDENGGDHRYSLSDNTFTDLVVTLNEGGFPPTGDVEVTVTSTSNEFDDAMFVIPNQLGQSFTFVSNVLTIPLSAGYGRISFLIAVPKYTLT